MHQYLTLSDGLYSDWAGQGLLAFPNLNRWIDVLIHHWQRLNTEKPSKPPASKKSGCIFNKPVNVTVQNAGWPSAIKLYIIDDDHVIHRWLDPAASAPEYLFPSREAEHCIELLAWVLTENMDIICSPSA